METNTFQDSLHLLKIEILCNITNVFSATFDKLNASLLIKVLISFLFQRNMCYQLFYIIKNPPLNIMLFKIVHHWILSHLLTWLPPATSIPSTMASVLLCADVRHRKMFRSVSWVSSQASSSSFIIITSSESSRSAHCSTERWVWQDCPSQRSQPGSSIMSPFMCNVNMTVYSEGQYSKLQNTIRVESRRHWCSYDSWNTCQQNRSHFIQML